MHGQAWTIDRLRPAQPYNPFLAEYYNNLKKQQQQQDNSSSSTTSLNVTNSKTNNNTNTSMNLSNGRSQSTGGIIPSTSSIMSFNSAGNGYNNLPQTISNEQEFNILALVDSFCNTNRHTGNILYRLK